MLKKGNKRALLRSERYGYKPYLVFQDFLLGDPT